MQNNAEIGNPNPLSNYEIIMLDVICKCLDGYIHYSAHSDADAIYALLKRGYIKQTERTRKYRVFTITESGLDVLDAAQSRGSHE